MDTFAKYLLVKNNKLLESQTSGKVTKVAVEGRVYYEKKGDGQSWEVIRAQVPMIMERGELGDSGFKSWTFVYAIYYRAFHVETDDAPLDRREFFRRLAIIFHELHVRMGHVHFLDAFKYVFAKMIIHARVATTATTVTVAKTAEFEDLDIFMAWKIGAITWDVDNARVIREYIAETMSIIIPEGKVRDDFLSAVTALGHDFSNYQPWINAAEWKGPEPVSETPLALPTIPVEEMNKLLISANVDEDILSAKVDIPEHVPTPVVTAPLSGKNKKKDTGAGVGGYDDDDEDESRPSQRLRLEPEEEQEPVQPPPQPPLRPPVELPTAPVAPAPMIMVTSLPTERIPDERIAEKITEPEFYTQMDFDRVSQIHAVVDTRAGVFQTVAQTLEKQQRAFFVEDDGTVPSEVNNFWYLSEGLTEHQVTNYVNFVDSGSIIS